MSFTGPAPDGASTPTVMRLAAVEHAVSSRIGEPLSPNQVKVLLDRANIPLVTGRGRPHVAYGTLAISRDDFTRLEWADVGQLRALAGLA